MREYVAGLIAAVALVAGLVAMQPAQAETVAAVQIEPVALLPLVHRTETVGYADGSTSTTMIDGKMIPTGALGSPQPRPWYLNGFRFNGLYVCQDNNIGTTFPLQTAGNYHEYNASPIIISMEGTEAAAGCAGYDDSQIIHYSMYHSSVEVCWKIYGAWTQPGDGYNHWFHVDAQINGTHAWCSDTDQVRANTPSRLTGAVIGLTSYQNADTGYVMNKTRMFEYWYAGIGDNARTAELY